MTSQSSQTSQTTIALAQIAPKLGDFTANLNRHAIDIAKAKEALADIVVFPELGLTGYQLQDLTFEVGRRIDSDEIQQLVRMSDGIDIVFSFIEESDEHFFYVCSIYASQGGILHIHRKVYLPTYGMFDEQRYVAAGQDIQSFEMQAGRAGLMICEDAWHVSVPYLLALGGSTLFIVQASSPARNVMDDHSFGSQLFWSELLEMYAQLFGVHIAFCNRVGYEDGVHFYGGSGVVGPDGQFINRAVGGDETLLMVQVDRRDVRRARYMTPLMRDERVHLTLSHLAQVERK